MSAKISLLCVLAALAACWCRLFWLLSGSPWIGFGIAGGALLAGFIAGWLLSKRVLPAVPAAPLWGALGTAIASLLALNIVRVILLNSVDLRLMLEPLSSTDAKMHMIVAPAVFLFPTGLVVGVYSALGGFEGTPVFPAGLAVIAFAAAAIRLFSYAGFSESMLLAHSGLGAVALTSAWRLGAWRNGLPRLAAVFAIAAVLGWKTKNIWEETEIVRINTLFPGARVVDHLAGVPELALARMDSGKVLRLREGMLPHGHEIDGILMAAIPCVLRDPPPSHVLVLGAGEGQAVAAAQIFGQAPPDVVEEDELPDAWFADMVRPLLSPDQPVPALQHARWDSYLSQTQRQYDVIIADFPRPFKSHKSGPPIDPVFLSRLQKRLSPDGIVAVWIPLPAKQKDIAGSVVAFAAAFPQRAAWGSPNGFGLLLMGSAAPIDVRYESLLKIQPTSDEEQNADFVETLMRQMQAWDRIWSVRPDAGGDRLLWSAQALIP